MGINLKRVAIPPRSVTVSVIEMIDVLVIGTGASIISSKKGFINDGRHYIDICGKIQRIPSDRTLADCKCCLNSPGVEHWQRKYPAPPHPANMDWPNKIPAKIERLDPLPVVCSCNSFYGCVAYAARRVNPILESKEAYQDWIEIWCTRCFANNPLRISLSALALAYKERRILQLTPPGTEVPEAFKWKYVAK